MRSGLVSIAITRAVKSDVFLHVQEQLGELLGYLQLIEAATGRLLFGSPSVDVGNTFRSFFRVTSFFRDPPAFGSEHAPPDLQVLGRRQVSIEGRRLD